MKKKFSVGQGAFGSCADRFCTGGYKPNLDLRARFDLMRKIKGLNGMEIPAPMFGVIPVPEFKRILAENKWKCSLVSASLFGDKKWGKGSITSSDSGIRREAILAIKAAMDVSREFGANRINLWLGLDGHNYAFETDYRETWDRIINGVAECAEYALDVQLCLEYKAKEPLTHIAMGNVGKLLWVAEKTGCKNVGGNLDVGHALLAGENPAESAVLLAREGRLFHLHFNDNLGDWDWDMTTGTVHFWELMELLFWLDELKYDGWYSLDIFPFREDPVEAVNANFDHIRGMAKLVEKLDRKEVLKALHNRDFITMNKMLMKIVYA